jgi:hypothetical protein
VGMGAAWRSAGAAAVPSGADGPLRRGASTTAPSKRRTWTRPPPEAALVVSFSPRPYGRTALRDRNVATYVRPGSFGDPECPVEED